MRFCGIHLRTISQWLPKLVFCIMCLKIVFVKLLAHLPGTNELIFIKISLCHSPNCNKVMAIKLSTCHNSYSNLTTRMWIRTQLYSHNNLYIQTVNENHQYNRCWYHQLMGSSQNKTMKTFFLSQCNAGSYYSVFFLRCWNRNIPGELGHYHGCWCPGDPSRQGISNHGIDYAG